MYILSLTFTRLPSNILLASQKMLLERQQQQQRQQITSGRQQMTSGIHTNVVTHTHLTMLFMRLLRINMMATVPTNTPIPGL
jgi:hypothetical protein